jgi:hypothetical protein
MHRVPVRPRTPYFRRLLTAFSPRPDASALHLTATADEEAIAGLGAIVATCSVTPSTGTHARTRRAEEAAGDGLPRGEADVALMLAIFSAVATRENETGRFLDALRRASDTLVVLVDLDPTAGVRPVGRDRSARGAPPRLRS